jgi:hypothetical protein
LAGPAHAHAEADEIVGGGRKGANLASEWPAFVFGNNTAKVDSEDERLDEGLEESFPASDPPSQTQPHKQADGGRT